MRQSKTSMRLQSFPVLGPAVLVLGLLLGYIYLQQRPESRAAQEPAAENTPRRPSPNAIKAWQNRKFGMFIHWGLYSIPAGIWKGEKVTDIYSEQIMLRAPIPLEEYTPLAGQFNPAQWDPAAVARLAKEAGMKFIVLTSKHHDGFSMFDTAFSNYNVVDGSPYARDVVKELADATRKEGLSFGVYFSSIDWHWGSVPDKRNNNPIPRELEDLNVGQITELMSNYGPMSEIWFDMGEPTPEQSKRWADTVHLLQPDCMVSGRVFNHQGDFTVMGDNAVPDHIIDEPWQTPGSIYHDTWGYRSWQERTDLPGKVREHLLNLVKVVSRGGNYLLNIGPRGDGSVVEFEADVLRSIGKWMAVNGEAIYDTEPQPFRQLEFGYATRKPGKLYLLITNWPEDGKLRLPAMRNPIKRAYFLTDTGRTELDTGQGGGDRLVLVEKPKLAEPVTVIVVEHENELSIAPPLLSTDNDGTYLLAGSDARTFFHYNGRGYYEKPKLYKMEWRFQVSREGDYAIEALSGTGEAARMVELSLNGQSTKHTVEPAADSQSPRGVILRTVRLSPGQDYGLTLTPPRPFVKGDALDIPIEGIRLRPAGATP